MAERSEEKKSLEKRTVMGAIWTTAASIGSRLIGVASTFVLTRFLPPDVQGEVGNTFILVSSASMISSLGLGQYIASQPKAGRAVSFHVTVYYLVAGLLAFGLCYALRGFLGHAFHIPHLDVFLPGLLFSVTLDRIATLPRNILARDMNFKVIGLRQAVGEVVYGGVTVLAAWQGFGGSSIVVGNIARGAIGILILGWVVDWRDWLEPTRLSPATTRKLFKFGLPLNVASFFHYGAGNWDNIIMGTSFNETTVGLYNQAYKLADLPATHIGEQIGDVLVPSFAHMEDPEERKRQLGRATGLLCLVIFPLAVGLGAVGETLVATAYTAEWAGVAPLLTILSVLSVVRPIGWLIGSYLQVVARSKAIMLLEIIKVGLIVGSMLLLTFVSRKAGLDEKHVPIAAAAGVGVGYGLNAVFYLWSLRSEGIAFRAVVKPVIGPLLACLPMVAAILAVRFGFTFTKVPNWARLIAEITLGGLIYVPSALVIARTSARDFLGLLRNVLRRRSKRPT
ncbi:MAG: oligosaccharide flippase family protein [Polyangiaceae bacterium]